MKPLSPKKREAIHLVPFRKDSESVYFFLQKRDAHAKLLPNWFGFFGGGLELPEAPEEGILREIEEELAFIPDRHEFFCYYEFWDRISHVFILEVDVGFESKIEVREGQYGKFFSEKEMQNEPLLRDEAKLILKHLAEHVKQKGI
ncbi:MAG: hypothetical protein A2664_02380 [Candidatus Taylorbacteria bacterium RIFCSPHIGHO2_01_FULL_46_22b]|uniref:Nudix hydrolase domain-containing protein n=1 Tax=Candidatus Taylorbacteria bacterium RIFCSPHIGHO2_01_FULL_46_22b TaxID=1802301 RepID=A0A1G2M307_9BACT|nr:MAG: hypothetical protein A2664_02380 [Candidatus Taylorbacteria bacterium RIFCSPHIGHO2_01_FULL_46_22b]